MLQGNRIKIEVTGYKLQDTGEKRSLKPETCNL